jgi:hypothetical protein
MHIVRDFASVEIAVPKASAHAEGIVTNGVKREVHPNVKKVSLEGKLIHQFNEGVPPSARYV